VDFSTCHLQVVVVVITNLLVIGGVELNPGPVENIVQVSCSGCNRNLELGIVWLVVS